MAWEIAVNLAFIGIALVFAYIAFKLDQEHITLKVFFFFFTLMVLIIGSAAQRPLLTASSVNSTAYPEIYNRVDQSYKLIVWAFRITITYALIYFFIWIFRIIKIKGWKKNFFSFKK